MQGQATVILQTKTKRPQQQSQLLGHFWLNLLGICKKINN